MAFVEQSRFNDKEVSLIYIAASTAEAEKVELVLTEKGIDYTLMEIPFDSFFGLSERPGLGFYVISGQADFCRNALSANSIESGIWTEDIDTQA
jgi:hypothetical protein